MKKCNNCNHENSDDVKFCTECGTSLEAVSSTKRFCSNCGNDVPLDANFCLSCGAEVTAGREQIRPDREQAKARKKRIAPQTSERRRNSMIALIVSVPLILLLFYKVIMEEESTSPTPSPGMGRPAAQMGAEEGDKMMGGVTDMIDGLRARIEADPNDFHAYLELGNMFSMIGRYDQAAEYFKESLDLNPDNAMMQMAMADALTKAGKVPEAILHLEKVVTLSPDDEVARFNLGILKRSVGDNAGAKAVWEELIKRNPASEYAITAQENIDKL